jgi:probable F420-dependent oxidoreductase
LSRTVTRPLRIGASVPTSGRLPVELGIPAMARRLEAAGFESLWVSDHIVLPETMASPYPFAADGKATWPSDTPYIDALIALTLIAASTERATIGTAVLVLALRHPIIFAKQAASIDVASRGRLRIGVGAGWLREEFDALDVPFERRGSRMAEWMLLARDCWTGTPRAHESERYSLPAGVLCYPTPVHEIPFLVGGHSGVALRRAGQIADGWLAQQSLNALAPEELAAAAMTMRAAASEAGRDPEQLQVVLRIVDSAGRSEELAEALPSIIAAGVDEIIVNVDWENEQAADYERLRRGAR